MVRALRVTAGLLVSWMWAQPLCGAAEKARVSVTFEQPLKNAEYPELLYWFVTPETLVPGQAERDVQHIAHDTFFTFAFLTERNGAFLGDNPQAHGAISEMVKDAHAAGLKVGFSVNWQALDGDVPPNTPRTLPIEHLQTVVSGGEAALDAQGHAALTVGARMRFAPPRKSELLRVYVFHKTAEGEYDPATLQDVTARAKAVARVGDPLTGVMDITLDLGPKYAGKTVFAMQQTWLNAMDVYDDGYLQWLHTSLDEYKDVAFDGTALDEFGYTRLQNNDAHPWRGQFAGAAFQQRFENQTRRKLPETLFATRYSPSGHPEVRIRAIDVYWDFLRRGPQRIEDDFYNYSRRLYGEKNFAGIHNTIHNHLYGDEPWASGINWWTTPRQYGMSDEDLSLPLRMGLLVSHPGNIMYDQFYGRDIHRFAEKALSDARYGGRIHYHGYNDTGRWGVNLASKAFLDAINPVEEKIRLLNRFDPAPPELPLLIVFGVPRLLNWYPEAANRNAYDLNGSLHIEEKVKAVWDAGYRCAVVPSDLIDNGMLRLNAQGHPVINGHVFRAVVYLYPEYAKPSTIAFLDAYVNHGGALMLEGTGSRDFDGTPVDETFARIAAKARVKGFSIDELEKLGIAKDPLQGTGGRLADGSVILTDLPSLQNHVARQFSVTVNGHLFTGSYEGVVALKANRNGRVEKLACGHCGPLLRDGREIVRLDMPADVLLTSSGRTAYHAVISGQPESNGVHVNP